ncbi:MAG: hypothetical protein ACRD5H_16290 [Nitrososphaerales archaeon]
MGDLIKNVGDAEIRTSESDFFKGFTNDSLKLMNEFSEVLQLDELGALMKLLLKLTNHTANLSKFFNLTPDQKIAVGQDLKSLADETMALMQKVKGRTQN